MPQVPNVIEATTPDQLLHRIEQTLPNVDRVLESVRDLSEDVRRIVNGPLQSVATRVDGLVQREAGHGRATSSSAPIARWQRIEQITTDLRTITQRRRSEDRARSSTNLDDASAEAKDLVATAKAELEQTGDALRGKLDKLDGVIDDTESITKKIDQDKGTLGRLVNDPAIADNVEQITDDAKGFLGTLFGLKAYVGLRSEYNVVRRPRAPLRHRRAAHAARQVLPDRAREGPARRLPRRHADVRSDRRSEPLDPQDGDQDKIRFTFQFAKRFSWLTLRYGIKESTGGIGADVDLTWWDRDLRFSADAFDASFDKYPRVKLALAYEMFRHIYVLGGVDELLNKPQTLRSSKRHVRRADPVRHVPLRPRLLPRRHAAVQRRGSRGAAHGRRLGARRRVEVAVKIATFNVNGVNARLAHLLEWLAREAARRRRACRS